MLLGLPAIAGSLPVLDIVHGEALGGDTLALGAAGAGPVPLRQLLPLHPHAQQVEAAGAAVTQGQGAPLWMVHLKKKKKKVTQALASQSRLIACADYGIHFTCLLNVGSVSRSVKRQVPCFVEQCTMH